MPRQGPHGARPSPSNATAKPPKSHRVDAPSVQITEIAPNSPPSTPKARPSNPHSRRHHPVHPGPRFPPLRLVRRLPTEFAADAQSRQASDNPSQQRKSSVGLGMSVAGGKADEISTITDVGLECRLLGVKQMKWVEKRTSAHLHRRAGQPDHRHPGEPAHGQKAEADGPFVPERRAGAGYFSGLRQVNASGPRRSNAMCLDERSDQSQLRPKIPVTILRTACPSVM